MDNSQLYHWALLVEELAGDLEAELADRYGSILASPTMKRRFDRDMAIVHKARSYLDSVGDLSKLAGDSNHLAAHNTSEERG